MVIVPFPLLIAASAFAVDPESETPKIDPMGLAVIERSQHTTSTYTVFSWNDVPEGKEFKDGWGAEFHSGDLHRVETPMSRSIADCHKRTGTNLNLKSRNVISNYTVANAACGINTNFPFRAVEWMGRKNTGFGEADRVRVTDDNSVVTYDVLDNGAIVGTTYVDRQGKPLVTSWATRIENKVPDGIFTPESLNRSFTPEQFKSPSARR
jgi:hypothetical protein